MNKNSKIIVGAIGVFGTVSVLTWYRMHKRLNYFEDMIDSIMDVADKLVQVEFDKEFEEIVQRFDD